MKPIHFPIEGVVYHSSTEAAKAYAEGHWISSTVGQLVRNNALIVPEKSFLLTDSSEISYFQFDKETEILAAALSNLGLRQGDRAIFQMGTVPETLIALFGCYKAGIIPVCTLPQHRELEIDTMLQLTQARAHFVQADFDAKFDLIEFARQRAKKHPQLEYVIVSRGKAPGVHSLEELLTQEKSLQTGKMAQIGSGDVLTFQLSGGSTGIPKIIPRFHGEYLGHAHTMVKRHNLTKSDRALWPLPLIHNAAMQLIVMPMLLTQGSIVLQQRFDIDAFLSAMEKFSVSYAGSIGPIASKLLDQKREMRSMRLFFALDRADAIEDQMKVTTTNLYGITEGLLMTSAPEDPSDLRFSSTGYPTSSADLVKVLLPDTEKEVPVGAEGELCFRGPYTLRGYYNAPEINEQAFTSDGFFRTGDLVRSRHFDKKISYTFVGRLKDNISRGGEKFAAEEVERLVVLHPAIADAKVVATPDPVLGEKACACLILRKGQGCPSVEELDQFLTKQGLARYKHPERIEVIDAFPITKVGKIDKATLRKLITAKIEQCKSQ